MMEHNFDVNIDYPLQDFKEDVQGVIAKDESNVIDFPPRIEIIDDKSKEVSTIIRPKTTSRMYTSTKYYIEKYGPFFVARSRWMRFMAIYSFVAKWRKLLIQKGLLKEYPPAIRDDLIEYLLRVKINPRSGKIPKTAINNFIRRSQR